MTNITFSAPACAHIKKMIEQNNGIGFRLAIKKTGCSGYSYLPSVIDKINPDDEMLEISGLKIFIAAEWRHFLQDLEVDFIEENKNGLKQKRLVFINPKEASRCGCGESFHVE